MRRLLLLSASLLLIVPARAEPFDLTPPALDAEAAAWVAFSDNLVAALRSGNHGVRCSALQQVVAYGPRVDVRAARFEVVRLFRDSPDERVRLLALSALAQLRDGWVADFLARSARFEKDPRLTRLYLHAAQQAAVQAG
jgi:hypothetical protein